MPQYIDKNALVAEIERRKQVAFGWMETAPNDAIEAQFELCDDILSFINTLEVKEVDFETAFAASIDHFDEKNNYGQWPESDLREFAEHFFEFGLKSK